MTKDYNRGAQVKNERDEWVPAIPYPYFLAIRKRCDCGKKFWFYRNYEAHYALEHILGL